MLLAGMELKTIADQLGHSSVVLTADTYLSVAVELGLKSAEEAARLVLKAGSRRPTADAPAGGPPRCSPKSPPDHQAPGNAPNLRRAAPPCPNDPEDPGQRQPGATAGPSACIKAQIERKPT